MHKLGRTVVLIDKLSWFQHTTLLFWCVWRSPTPPNSSGNVQKHGHLLRFQANGRLSKISGFRVIGKSDVHAKGQDQRSEVKVTEVKTQISCFRTVTLAWIHICWRNDVQGLICHRRWALSFSRSSIKFQGHTGQNISTQFGHFWTVTPVWIHRWLWNDAQSLK